MTLSQLKDYLKEHPNTAKQIMFYGSKIRSTRPYWSSRCGELLDLVNDIGPPTVFFTLSSADYHWPDPFRLLGIKNPNKLSISEKRKIMAENPLLFDQFFVMRSQYFIDHCFSKKYKVKDIWYRYEYQHRGSIHLHGVAWFHDAPELKNIDNEKIQNDILKYFDEIISCENPDVNCTITETHPCAMRLSDVTNLQEDLSQLINRVQRHTKCSEKTCKTKNGKKLTKCKYNFPFELNETSRLIIEDGEITDMIFKRNDPLINKLNKWLIQSWRANIDISPIYNETSIYHYIAKYASKCESKSIEYSEILKNITTSGENDNESCKKTIRKLLISACAERDYCAQEVMHYLMGFPFYRCSRDFVILNMNHFSWSSLEPNTENKTLIQYYASRPTEMDDLNLYEFCKFICVRKGSFEKRKKPAIIRIFPKMAKMTTLQTEDIERLHFFFVPWRSISDLNIDIKLKEEKVTEKEEMINMYLFKKTMDCLKEKFPEETNNHDEGNDNKKFEPISSLMPIRKEESTQIGYRPLDKNNNWKKWNFFLDDEVLNTIYDKIREPISNTKKFELPVMKLNDSQKKVMEELKLQVLSIIKGSKVSGNVTIIQGSAGTGKTSVLKHMFNYIIDKLGTESVCLLAPTGTAAKLINGHTIHSYLKLGRRFKNITPLVADDLLKFQEDKHKIQFALIDEYSMIGCRLLAAIEERFRQMKDNQKPFGDLYVYLIGDCHQLVPCGDSALFRSLKGDTKGNGLLERGKLLLRCVDNVHFLSKNYRANVSNYCDFLERVSMGNCSKYDLKKINERCVSLLTKTEIGTFSNSLKLCATNEIVDEFNINKIVNLKKPIACINAQNNSRKAFSSSSEKADGLVNTLYLCEGAKVMLKRNINVSRGLVNGSIGNIYRILHGQDEEPPNMPLYILIEFHDINLTGIGLKYIPIKPVLATWTEKGKVCSRLQLPLVLAWACTIHKGQGIGIDRMILDMGETEFCIGLIYTALSRISSFSSLILIRRLTIERLNAVKRSKGYLDLVSFLDWLKSKVN
ncbi:uncharacterized protein LOC117644210 [Thrips palmi]|uniref:ATP-dependent DNA helicase n=1 Tax=Thrips palmi TaxID=161013 RepID=A0A6P8YYL9_THRPL|nr:uncharacterized protein LOC117644210 [Thrips palmi]